MKKSTVFLATLILGLGISAWGDSGQHSPPQAGSTLTLDSNLTILLSPHEPPPVVAATQDLAGDFEKVLGKKPIVIDRAEDAAPVTILIGEQSNLPENLRPFGLIDPESFAISAASASWKSGPATKVVLLAGADMRGTIYAIYEFAEEYLGIDPFYYWTDHQPAKRRQIELPASLEKKFLE